MRSIPENTDDTIDSRDIIERIEELEGNILPWRAKLCDFAGIDKEECFADYDDATEALADWLDEHAENYASAVEKEACEGLAIDIRALADGTLWEGGVGDTALVATIEPAEVDADDAEELRILKALAEEAENYAGDWHHGATLIRESYFAEYVEDLLKDTGALPQKIPAYVVIDWEKTAENVRVDYTEIDFDGITYLIS